MAGVRGLGDAGVRGLGDGGVRGLGDGGGEGMVGVGGLGEGGGVMGNSEMVVRERWMGKEIGGGLTSPDCCQFFWLLFT